MRGNRSLIPLMEALGYRFVKAERLLRALTHPSAAPDGADNQRLEFLGDAVLQLCVSEALYVRHPDMREGDLTQLRAAMVREESLCQAARRFQLGAYMRFDHGEEATGGRDKPSVLADAMEAVLAAVFLDGGLEAAKALCGRMYQNFTPAKTEPNWKSLLQEREQAAGRPAPTYAVVSEEGPPHARVFTVQAQLEGGICGTGSGVSKKHAEQEAAKAAMEAGTSH